MGALYIRDEDVAAMAEKLQVVLGTPTKTEAVRRVFKDALEAADKRKTPEERMARIWEMAKALGPGNPNFDYRKFKDEESEF